MSETEFWRDLKPITSVFRADALPVDEQGEPAGHFDVFDYIELCRSHYARVGLGAECVESLFR